MAESRVGNSKLKVLELARLLVGLGMGFRNLEFWDVPENWSPAVVEFGAGL